MDTNLSIWCFKDLRFEIDGKCITTFDTDKSKALLVYLAIENGNVLKRSHLAGLLWPDESEERALHNLRQALSSLRKVVGVVPGGANLILADREMIMINPKAHLWVDCLEFKQAVRQAFLYFQNEIGNGLFNIRQLMRAAQLYKGDFLSGFSISNSVLFEEWMLLKREEFNQEAIRVLTQLGIYYEKRAEYSLAIEAADRVIELCPWDESAWTREIRLLAVNGQFTAAKNLFQRMKRYMTEQFSSEPSEGALSLYRQICQISEESNRMPPEYTPERFLPLVSETMFVGREIELDTLMGLLVIPQNRLITILGMGGSGKTQLALQLASQLIGVCRDGVFFVSLLSAKEPEQVISLVSEAVGCANSGHVPPLKQLIDHLRERQVLIILDNFEHMLSEEIDMNWLDTLLRSTRNLKILITSRELLNLYQEQVYLLPGMSFPFSPELSLEQLLTFDAIKLFIERVSQKVCTFKITDSNVRRIVWICKRLEGLPLGVELAAATTCEQGFEQAWDVFEKDLGALTTRMPNFQERHRSLEAVITISWQNLSVRQQAVFATLSLFLDGFTPQAAREITGAEPGFLAKLVSRSLLRVNAEGRYSMHEAIRIFAENKLIATAEFHCYKNRHAQFYAALLSRLNHDLLNENELEALTAIREEFGNISVCWQWIVEQQDTALMQACIDSLYHYFSVRSLWDEGITWFLQAAERIGSVCPHDPVLGMLLWRIGAMAYVARDNSLMYESLIRSQEILLNTDAVLELAYCRVHLGWVYQREKDFILAQKYADLALETVLEVEDIPGLLQTYLLAGSIENRQGNYLRSKPLFETALNFCRKTKNPLNTLVVLNRLGDIVCYEGDYEKALIYFNESLEISEALNDRYNQAILLNNLGTIAHIKGEYPTAKSFYKRSLSITREIGDRDGIALALSNLGELATCEQDYQEALSYSEKALEIAREIGEYWTIIVCLNSLGEIYFGIGAYEKSQAFYQEAIALAIEAKSQDLTARVLINLARVYQFTGKIDQAVTLLKAAVSHSSTEKDSREKGCAWLIEMGETIPEEDDAVLEALIAQLK